MSRKHRSVAFSQCPTLVSTVQVADPAFAELVADLHGVRFARTIATIYVDSSTVPTTKLQAAA